MKDIIEAFAPSGCEEQFCELLKSRLGNRFESVCVDNMGNLIAKMGNGGLCIECGMDSVGVMAVSQYEKNIRFSAVGNVKVNDLIGRRIVFENGAFGEVCCDEEADADKRKISDLYIKLQEGAVEKGNFGAVSPEFCEEDGGYTAYGLQSRIAVAAVIKALEKVERVSNVTILFSAQKRLGARGLRAFFGVNSFERIIMVDGCMDDGCAIVAKDEKVAANSWLRKELERLAREKNIDAQTVVSERNFFLEQIAVACGDSCVAIGVSVLCNEDEPDRVNKCDFDAAVLLLEEILKGWDEGCM